MSVLNRILLRILEGENVIAAKIQDEFGQDWQEQLAQETNATEDPVYIWSTRDTVAEMKAEAKRRGLAGYSRLREAELIDLLNGTPND